MKNNYSLIGKQRCDFCFLKVAIDRVSDPVTGVDYYLCEVCLKDFLTDIHHSDDENL